MEQNNAEPTSKFDAKEFEFPETLFVRDIENRVFQGIVIQCLSEIEGVSLLEGNFINHILGASLEGIKGISAEQDSKNHSVSVKIELNIDFGVPIPPKAEEIQAKIAEEITHMTGLHVSCVHVVFKNITHSRRKSLVKENDLKTKLISAEMKEDVYSDTF